MKSRLVSGALVLMAVVWLAGRAHAQVVAVPEVLSSQPLPAGVAQQPTSGALPRAFTQQTVIDLAKRLAQVAYKPADKAPAVGRLPANYDDYRKLRFRTERALWRRVPPSFELHPLAAGWLYKQPISLFSVAAGAATPVTFSLSDFNDDREDGMLPTEGLIMPLSGFRINGGLNSPNTADEIVVFQGASYFRALGEGHRYGLSARGLAIATASRRGEEFPSFRTFWVEKPDVGSKDITIHALLDSVSTTGAYQFIVRPGAETIIDVKALLFPRREMTDVGLAPLTSMNMLTPTVPTRVSDFRPRVHDSDGLAILNGQGERIWRPLSNPYALQVSSFSDDQPKGFGLMQRHRRFSDYQDLEARYDLRPSAWIEPGENFGKGSVTLVEIPTEQEIHDNIVAFWRPQEKLVPGREYPFSYRIRWRNDSPLRPTGPWVAETRSGADAATPGALRFVVDYLDNKPFTGAEPAVATVQASSGTISKAISQLNPETGGIRVSFLFTPGATPSSDLRLTLGAWDGRTPETWIYRWSVKKR